MQDAARIRRARLSDGREIVYFDDAGHDRQAPPPDRRSMEPVERIAELRHDALVDEWVVAATHRQDRTHLPVAADCPLCPSAGDRLTEIPAEDYDVVVFENRFPSLPAGGDGRVPAGRCEVVCFTADHAGSFAELSDARLRTVASAWVQRTAELGDVRDVEYVFCFENRGQAIGVTLDHPHGQIYAYPYLPPRLGRMLEATDRHRRATGRCLACDLLAQELSDGSRIVAETTTAVAYVPRAARWPFELHVVPRRHVGTLGELSAEELSDAVLLQADGVHRFDRLFAGPIPYMAGWIQRPTTGSHDLHLRLELVSPQRNADKLKYLAGSESLMGAFVSDVLPEDAAQRLRAISPRPPR